MRKKTDPYKSRIHYDKCFPALRDFLSYSNAVKGLSNSTIHGYYTDITLLFKYLKHKKIQTSDNMEDIDITDIDDDFLREVTGNDIFEFLSFTSKERANTKTTRARKASAYRMFFKYLHLNKKIITEEPTATLDIPKKSNTVPKYLNEQDCITLLNSIEGDNSERDYCLITVMLNCGVRVSELVDIDLDDIQKDGTIIIRGKGDKERMLYFNDACQEAVEEYQNAKKIQFCNRKYDTRALFLGKTGKRLTARRVEQIVQDRMKVAGFGNRGISPHKLRHSYATRIYKNGTDLRLLKDILGHSSLSTTQIYTHIASEDIKKAMNDSPIKKG